MDKKVIGIPDESNFDEVRSWLKKELDRLGDNRILRCDTLESISDLTIPIL